MNKMQLAIIGTIVLGLGFLFLLVSQKGQDIEAKYREVVDVFAIARELELDMDQFKMDIDNQEVHEKVASDKAYGERLMGNQIGTPAIFVNEERFVSNGRTVEDLLNQLKEELEERIDNGETPKVVEFFDYNCIHCANLDPGINQLVNELGDKIEFEKKHLPFLRSSSQTYAFAAEAANKQGKFNEFSTILFERIHGI